MEQKRCLRFVYKIHTKRLKKAKWDLFMPIEMAMQDYPDEIVSLSDSQCLRFIDEINGVTDLDVKVQVLKRKIRFEKKKQKSRATKRMVSELYSNLYNLQFVKDYVCVVMGSEADYDRANKGFKINDIKYRRFLGTNGGIKTSTIVYVNEEIYPELKRRLDNGRNKEKEFVPAKLEAYQALICSGSTPIPPPNGFIVVKDCITRFKDNVIVIDDEKDGEPELTYVDGYDVEHNDSDGYGLMLPDYSRRVNEYLTGSGETIAGMNTRCAFLKGMVYTFDFLDFAENVAHEYLIEDVWGDVRDIRNAEVILTESMLKLWSSYDNWEDYERNCKENHYDFATPKITPPELENTRDMNYQFLQSYELNDDELRELCEPTISEIKDVLGMDWRKSLAFLAGYGINEKNIKYLDNDFIKALMIDARMINDPYVRSKIYSMIKTRIDAAKKGSIKVNANFAMISGDPYALCQSMFGLEVTGLLKAGEVYHKYWVDKGSDEIVLFRAPMSNANNITCRKLNKSNECSYWYKYMDTSLIYNAWDTTCDAMNGCDFDGDTNMCTDNPVLVKNTKNLRTIMCIQRNAVKKVPTEEDIIAANKLGFNDEIGTVTNYITSMFEVQANYDCDSEEYKTLEYRIMCGQAAQQATIDRIKGIIAKPMPEYWHNKHKVKDSSANKNTVELNRRIVAYRKPYFMIYIYSHLKKRYKQYVENSEGKSILVNNKSPREINQQSDFSKNIKYYSPVGRNKCLVNRIAYLFEDEFDSYSPRKSDTPFDYNILKCGSDYSRADYDKVLDLYKKYLARVETFHHKTRSQNIDKYDAKIERKKFIDEFKMMCEKECPNEDELCDIVLDICYTSEKSKNFAWDVCGDKIIENLLKLNDYKLMYPCKTEEYYDFEYAGKYFKMQEYEVEKELDIDSIERNRICEELYHSAEDVG